MPDGDSISQFKFCPWLKENGTQTIYLDNLAVYYKPAASAEYTAVLDYPTLTVSVPGGIETEAAKALCDSPSRYFGNAVSACAINGKTMTLTLNGNSGAAEVVIPSLVNADKSAAYNEKAVEIPSADYNSLLYGAKSFCEDYERFSSDYEMKDSDWKLDNNVWHAYSGFSARKILADENGKYLAAVFSGSSQYPLITYASNNNYFAPMTAGTEITMLSDIMMPSESVLRARL